MKAVTDTGPMLHLEEAGALAILGALEQVIISPLIRAELRSHLPSLGPVPLPDWVRVESPSVPAQQRARAWIQAGLLHGGEAEVLAVALEVKPDWFLTDDAAARLMAESLGLEVHGSIGVLLWAAYHRHIEPVVAERYLTGLEQSSLWISPRVRTEARAALGRITR